MSNISLAEMLQRKTLPAKPLQLEILRQVAAQLDQAHQRALIHGNLTPQSILVSELGTDGRISVFVKDFGTRFEIDPAAMGAPPSANAYYLSPEQVLGIDMGPQSDEFSLAVIAYEMVSGSRPFTAPKLSGLIFSLCSDPPKPIDEVDHSLTMGVAYVFGKALARDREVRYATCGEFIAALEKELLRCEGWNQVEPAAEEPATIAVPAGIAAATAQAAVASRASASVAEPPPIAPSAPPPFDPGASARDFVAPEREHPPQPHPSADEPLFRTERPRFDTTNAPPNPGWNQAQQTFDPRVEANRPGFGLPPARRRNRYLDEEEPDRSGSFVKRFAIAGLILVALAGIAFYLFNRAGKPDLPTQVLDTKTSPVTPAPGSTSTASTATQPTQASPPEQAQTKPQIPEQQQTAPPPPSNENASSQPSQSAAPAPSQAPSVPNETRPSQVGQTAPPIKSHQTGTNPPAGRSRGGLVDVELLSEPPGANMLVDNNSALSCKAPCNISLTEGRHTLSASLPGYASAQRIFNVPETTSMFVAMPKLTGTLVVTSNPNAATILVDGKDYGLTPATLHLPPGQHQITLMNGSQRHDTVVNVVADGIQATGYTFPR